MLAVTAPLVVTTGYIVPLAPVGTLNEQVNAPLLPAVPEQTVVPAEVLVLFHATAIGCPPGNPWA